MTSVAPDPTPAPGARRATAIALDHLVLPLARVRSLTAWALFAAAAFVVAGVATTPHDDGTTAGLLDQMALHPERTQISDLLLHLGWTGAALACIGLALLGSVRRGPLLLIGCALAAIGLTTLPGLFATDAYDMAIAQELPRALGIAVSEEAASKPIAALLFISGSLGAALGPVLLLAALWRQGTLGIAPWVLTVVGPLISVIGNRGATAVIGATLLGLGYALAGWELVRRRT
ncbi:hypothetical protein VSS74_20540 [Conexibacter stalactiti]|uniref:DUF4386 family protein n=1 Tax=Conexibacter stalactiti TaxID=1940611 RepID=A0ABU4HTW3_9ACTN|nr:hypothetical protein [Conexibacter stalactiti]MDW5596746.1 hypothetical protein [Conexibacter stalactiti]MEC5037388.1 hypothetical protein [Conexibacter stalactiti]